MRPIYVPIADSFFESSIMQEELAVRFVMLALIRLALRVGAEGVVDVDLRTFAASVVMPVKDVERAIRRLMEPDEYSASGDEEGRRVVPVDPERPLRGWRLVNWPKYRHLVHKANDAARKRDERRGAKADTPGRTRTKEDASETVPKRPRSSVNGGDGATKNEIRRTKNEERLGRESASRFAPPSLDEVREYGKEIPGLDAAAFHDFYASKGWKVGSQPMKDWKAAARNWMRRDAGNGKDTPRVVIHKNQSDIDREREGDEIARNRAAATRAREEREGNENGWLPPDTPEERAESERLCRVREAQLAAEKARS